MLALVRVLEGLRVTHSLQGVWINRSALTLVRGV